MNNNQQINYNDEIDLRDLFFALWCGKIYIIFISIICVFFASLYLHSAERKYSVEYNLKSVGETNNSEPDGDADAEAMFDALLDENEDLGEYSEEN